MMNHKMKNNNNLKTSLNIKHTILNKKKSNRLISKIFKISKQF